jgi:hypothetical protein
MPHSSPLTRKGTMRRKSASAPLSERLSELGRDVDAADFPRLKARLRQLAEAPDDADDPARMALAAAILDRMAHATPLPYGPPAKTSRKTRPRGTE